MRSGGTAAASWRILLLSLLCTVVLANDKPEIKATPFKYPPLGLSYFEDSDVIVFHDYFEMVIYRSDDAGFTWSLVDDIPGGQAWRLNLHPFEPKTAFVLTEGTTHYKTKDRGETWTKFNVDTLASEFQGDVLSFHADDPERIIFNGMACEGFFSCDEEAMWTSDGFDTVKALRPFTAGCWWAKSSKEFTTGDEAKDKDRTMCITRDPFSFFKSDQRLHVSDSYFGIVDDSVDEFEPNMDTSRGVSGVVNLAVVKKFLLVATAAPNSDEMELYITDDTVKWHRAVFPSDDSHDHSHQINQNAYTVLESTDYSVQIDVMTSVHPLKPMGVLFTSNSNGTYFTENVPYTNRNEMGHVDFEKISGIQGIFLVNIVENGNKVDDDDEKKRVVTQITFDDGRTFQEVKAGKESIHLHSVTELDNLGRVFSSPAPGLVMGNGNTGESLKAFADADLYVSDNAGVSWTKALEGPHKYEFGDSGSLLVAVKDSTEEDVKEIRFSMDHGQNWEAVELPDGLGIKPDLITTTQDSTSLKFLLLGEHEGKNEEKYVIIAIDFAGLNERTCGKGDMEEWHARVDEDGKSTCLMGHKQTYSRRKKDADCFINNEKFEEPLPQTDNCECTDEDFECDYNFQRDPEDHSKCIKMGPIAGPDKGCEKESDTFKGSSGWRLIPGNTCNRKDGKQKDDEVERDCSDIISGPSKPGNGEITATKFSFETKLHDFSKIYLEADETVIARPVEDEGNGRWRVQNPPLLSSDHGKTWNPVLKDVEVGDIYPHQYFEDVIYFTTPELKVYYTVDRGHTFHSFDAPTKVKAGFPLSFHPDKKDWLLWVGESCDDIGGCFLEASISTDRGDHWKTLLRYVERCEFTGHSAYKNRAQKQILCLAREDERNDSPLTIKWSNDFFEEKAAFDREVTNFATMSEFILVAGEDKESGDLHALASLDGEHYEQAHFPYNFHDDHSNQYTVLDSSTHAVNLFVLTEAAEDRQYGSIIKSNSNGTSYVLSASNVNCNEQTYVDFEKVASLEGVVLINIVSNPGKDAKTKDLQTKISHTDGSDWGFLAPPGKDVEGDSYKCSSSKGDESCALHLHHYTERLDKRKTFAASTAVGLMFGIGNVGSKLGDIEDADTFMTADGGVTWKNVKKGHWTWQYGDQGSIIVLVQRATPYDDAKTDMVSYSTDEGKTWQEYTFAKEKVTVLDITTQISGTARSFLLWCRRDNGELFSMNLDFSGLADKACEFDEGDENKSDYFLWSPKHPLQDDDCLFGHVAKYLRKKPDRKCYNDQNIKRLYKYSDCSCSRRDYECAYNFELDNHGQCVLVQGLKPLSGPEWCAQNPNETTWFEPTGYRRVPLSTCKGGSELDKTSTEHPCDGYEDEFEKKHGASGLAIFFAVIIPLGLATAIGWWVYTNWSSHFGQIRLGEQSTAFDSDQPWIKYPVVVVSAVVAVAATLPVIVGSLWRYIRGGYERVGGGGDRSWFSGGPRRFTTRDSFARGRGDYAVVDEDEGELLGDDSDEEV